MMKEMMNGKGGQQMGNVWLANDITEPSKSTVALMQGRVTADENYVTGKGAWAVYISLFISGLSVRFEQHLFNVNESSACQCLDQVVQHHLLTAAKRLICTFVICATQKDTVGLKTTRVP